MAGVAVGVVAGAEASVVGCVVAGVVVANPSPSLFHQSHDVRSDPNFNILMEYLC